MTARDRLRVALFFEPATSIPLALVGLFLLVATPLIALVPYGWLASPVAAAVALVLSKRMRARYRLTILDSSPLGTVTWLQRLRG